MEIIACLVVAGFSAGIAQWVNDKFELGGYMKDESRN